MEIPFWRHGVIKDPHNGRNLLENLRRVKDTSFLKLYHLDLSIFSKHSFKFQGGDPSALITTGTTSTVMFHGSSTHEIQLFFNLFFGANSCIVSNGKSNNLTPATFVIYHNKIGSPCFNDIIRLDR